MEVSVGPISKLTLVTNLKVDIGVSRTKKSIRWSEQKKVSADYYAGSVIIWAFKKPYGGWKRMFMLVLTAVHLVFSAYP